jgi:hypothetical protein
VTRELAAWRRGEDAPRVPRALAEAKP